MSFADRMKTGAEIATLLTRYSIQDPTDLYRETGGTEISFKRKSMQHQKLKRGTKLGGEDSIGNMKAANVLHQRIRTKDKIAHLELAETRDSNRRDEAVYAASLAFIDPETGLLRPGASMDEMNRVTAEVRKQFDTTSTYGTNILMARFHPNPVVGVTIPCYHLPWNPAGCAMRLRIPNKGGGPASDTNPVFFLTSALSGCSIYILGTPQEPIVYHCGTEGMTGGKNSKQFWDSVMKRIGHDVQDDSVGAIHASDYMLPKRGESGPGEDRRKGAEKTLKKSSGRDFKVESTSSWGAVFGLRDPAGNWRFYLQQNISVVYYEYKATGPFGLGRKRLNVQRTASRPALLQEIFPAPGSGAARLVEPQLRLT